jgi:hypothetical protein
MEGTSGLSLEPYLWRQHSYLWRQHSSANLSPKQRSCRALSRSATADKEAAFGEPCSCRHNNTLICWILFLTKCVLLLLRMLCFWMRCAPAGCRRASRVHAGRPGAGRKKAVAHRMYSDVRVCTSMCPLIQDKKSAVKVYTGMYSVHTSISFIWEFHTEIYWHILSYTYNCTSRHILRYTFGQ